MTEGMQTQQWPTKFQPEVLDALARSVRKTHDGHEVHEAAELTANDYMAVWMAHSRRWRLQELLADDSDGPSDSHQKRLQDELDSVPEVSALYALAAQARVIELLKADRWPVMDDAHKDGASFTEIGAALKITKQGARDYYARFEHVYRAIEETLAGRGEAVEVDWRS